MQKDRLMYKICSLTHHRVLIMGSSLLALLLAALPLQAQEAAVAEPEPAMSGQPSDSVYVDTDGQPLPTGTVFSSDSLAIVDSTQMQVGLVDSKIQLLTRTYGDSIVLRWATEDYATWRHVNRVGIDIFRYSKDEPTRADTLAHGLRPITLEQFRQRYPTTDTLAFVAAGLLYDETNKTKPTGTKNPPGTLGSLYEIYQEQQMRFGYAVLISEWRRDLAEALAMRIVDKTARKGKTYEYILRPTAIDTTGHMIIRSAHIPELKNERYHPEPLHVDITDSLIAENNVQLWWQRRTYSSFEVERRALGETEWQRITDKPYLDMSPDDMGQLDTICSFTDVVPEVGFYEYRVLAHDAFGDLTEPSPVHRVHVRDITPPKAPNITLITIDRRDTTDLSKGVFATFYVRKDTLEADYNGWYLLYYHERDTQQQWRKLSPTQSIADSILVLDVTGLTTGMVAVAATDTAGNEGLSMAQMLRLEDLKAPDAPTNLHAESDAEAGTITLSWDAPEDPDIEYYEVAYANDTTHRWVLATEEKFLGRTYVDSVDVTANQKYIYYKVKAIDYSTNESPYSDVLQVVRPSAVPPTEAHIDSAWTDTAGIHMKWIVSAEHFVHRHFVWRRLATDEEWTLLRVCDADSLAASDYALYIDDKPEYTRDARYEYAIESLNYSGISNEKSLAYSIRWEGEAIFPLPLKLYGEYLTDKDETRLVWEMPQQPPYKGRWYFCIFRQGPDDDEPQFFLSAKKDDRVFSDHLLQPGQQASYFIRVKYADGRQSEDSNLVTVRRAQEEKKQ